MSWAGLRLRRSHSLSWEGLHRPHPRPRGRRARQSGSRQAPNDIVISYPLLGRGAVQAALCHAGESKRGFDE